MMFATRWEPWIEMNRLGRELDRAFSRGATGVGRRLELGVSPHLNVWEDGENFYAEAELPGYFKDDIEICVIDNQLTLKGARRPPQNEGGNWHRQERGFGTFSRTVDLPGDVEGDKVSADLKLGVLKITLPKREEAKPRRIDIKVQ